MIAISMTRQMLSNRNTTALWSESSSTGSDEGCEVVGCVVGVADGVGVVGGVGVAVVFCQGRVRERERE